MVKEDFVVEQKAGWPRKSGHFYSYGNFTSFLIKGGKFYESKKHYPSPRLKG